MTLQEAIETVFETLPETFDVTPDGEFVADDTEHGDMGYFNNSEYRINIIIDRHFNLAIEYQGESYEDDDYITITDKFGCDIVEYENLSKDELRYKLIAMFSETIGWIDNFQSHKFDMK